MNSSGSRFLGVLVLATLVSCVEPPAAEHGSEPPAEATSRAEQERKLVVASYNVFYGNAVKEGPDPKAWGESETLRVAMSLGADVLALQETNEAWKGALEAAGAATLPHCKFHEPVKFLPEGLGVCSRFPIVEDELIPSAVGWFPAQRTVVATPMGNVEILNVHLKPAVASAEDWWAVHRDTRADRDREMRSLLARLSSSLPTIVVGDFNDVIEGDVFMTLAKTGFDNTFSRLPTESTSWTWAGADPPLAALLDHVAYERSAFRATSAQVVAGGRSDHQPVIASFELP